MVGIFSALVFFSDFILRVTNSYLRASQSINTPIPGLSEFIGVIDQSVANPQTASTKQSADYTPFMVTLVTVVWSGMRRFSNLERRFKLSLQEHAAVPNQARDLIETFKSEAGNFLPNPGTIDKVVELSERRIRRKDFECSSGSNDCNYSARYARVESLHFLLRKYKREHVFSRLTERDLGEFQDLEQTMNKVRGRITKQLEDIRAAAVEEGLRVSSLTGRPRSVANFRQVYLRCWIETLKINCTASRWHTCFVSNACRWGSLRLTSRLLFDDLANSTVAPLSDSCLRPFTLR